MKRLFSLIALAAFIFCIGCFSASASGVLFSATDVETKNNRIFTVTVSGSGPEALCAAQFDFTYNSSIIEFRSAKAADSGSAVKFHEDNGSLRLIFLNENGVDLSESPQLFTVDFKAENLTEEQTISFTVSDCVNFSVENFAASGKSIRVALPESTTASSATKSSQSEESGSALSGKISAATVPSETAAGTHSGVQEESAQGENSGGQTASESSHIYAAEAAEDSRRQPDGESLVSVDAKNNTVAIYLAGAVIMAVLIAIFGIAYHIGKKGNNSDKKET